MKILITGICGFAGSIIARGLLEHVSGLLIIGLDNLCRRGSETNVEPLRALGIDVRLGDIRNEDDIASLPQADWVIDCAANPSVLAGVDGKTSAKELLDHNLGGTIHLLEYCRRHGAGFLLLSTSRVYSIRPLAELPVEVRDEAFQFVESRESNAECARPSSLASRPVVSRSGVTESFPTDPPISLYGSSKKCSELLALEYGATFNFPVRINRCGVLAGACQFGKADQGIFSYWIHSWASQRPLKYIGFGGKGHQVRDCLHPRDLVPLLVRQLEDPGNSAPPILNIAGGTENSMSLAQLSRWCARRFPGSEIAYSSLLSIIDNNQSEIPAESRPFDIPWMVLDSQLASIAWEWKPQTTLGSVLEEIARHAESNAGWLDLVA